MRNKKKLLITKDTEEPDPVRPVDYAGSEEE
jgi:hypothetical protein